MRIRLIHAQIRGLLADSEEWDSDAWGTPLSSAHLGYAITAFSARLLKHMKRMGASYTPEEAASFMAAWRYSGYLMGIPESILFPRRKRCSQAVRDRCPVRASARHIVSSDGPLAGQLRSPSGRNRRPGGAVADIPLRLQDVASAHRGLTGQPAQLPEAVFFRRAPPGSEPRAATTASCRGISRSTRAGTSSTTS